MERDRLVRRRLEELGWQVLVIWQCEIRAREDILARITRSLGPRRESESGIPEQLLAESGT